MGQANDRDLIERARALLAPATRQPDASEGDALLSTALACHSRMLEIGEQQRATAIRLAVAGADLLARMQSFTPAANVPSWVPIHEEQCCRYGGIWIHELVQTSPSPPPDLAQQALRLLGRLQELHPAPVDWIANMRHQLETQLQGELPAPAAPTNSTTGDPPTSLYDCVWVSNSPRDALRLFAHSLLSQAPGETRQLQQLVDAAQHLRDHTLTQQVLERLAACPPRQPWASLFNLQLQQAHGASIQNLQLLACEALQQLNTSNPQLDERSWRLIASLLHNHSDPKIQQDLNSLITAIAPVELSPSELNISTISERLETRKEITPEDARHASLLYASAPASIRAPFSHWADPEAADPCSLAGLVNQIRQARREGRGFSLVRLGDGEGLFLCGRRPNLGGAIINGTTVEPRLAAQGNQLQDPEHLELRQRLAQAVASADWIGIPDIQQCLSGPVDFVAVAAGLSRMLSPQELSAVLTKLKPGGCHVHNYLLQAGYYGHEPFDAINAVIAPSLPFNLKGADKIIWHQIPGEAYLRPETHDREAHYPAIFSRTLNAISTSIKPGNLVLVGAGILGKIYCDAIRRNRGIAIDVGSVIDICSGLGCTRGEYRMHPWLAHHAKTAFQQTG